MCIRDSYKVSNSDFIGFIDEFFSDKLSKGLNVTLPHKKIATKIKGEISKEASYINAVNTIVNEKNGLFLYSTDGIGFLNDIDNKGFDFKNKNILMVGAGAAMESVLYRVAQRGVVNSVSFIASCFLLNTHSSYSACSTTLTTIGIKP